MDRAKEWDLFIAHASEDKEVFVRPLAGALRGLGMAVWYDEFSLKPGDSISRSIDKGILGSLCGLVVISPKFIEKKWPEYELRGLTTREMSGNSVIIPIWYAVDQSAVEAFSPSLADKLALKASEGSLQDVALKILMQVRPDLYESRPRSELIKLAGGEATPAVMRQVEELNERLDQKQRAYDIQASASSLMTLDRNRNLTALIEARHNTILASYLNRGYDFDTANKKAGEDVEEENKQFTKFSLIWILFMTALVCIMALIPSCIQFVIHLFK